VSEGVGRVRYALLSDIHANRPALEATLSEIDRQEVDAIYHLGDLVGYAPWADEVVSLIQERRIPGVAGNYDSTVATDYKHCGCKYEDPRQEELSHVSYDWTRRHIAPATKAFLGELPFRLDLRPAGGHISRPTVVLVHGTPTLNTLYWTEDRSEDFSLKMAQHAGMVAGDVIAFGHTHIPWYREIGGIHFVNTGSVGRPKDGNPRSSYVLLTLEGGKVETEIVRVPYDLARATAGIRSSGLPGEFAEALLTGGRLSP
jgi:predicted phosphodiesterase